MTGADTIQIYLWKKTEAGNPESRELLKRALISYCREKGLSAHSDKLIVWEGACGKPYVQLAEAPEELFFSVSHTRSWWICAVWNQELGADIEERGRTISPAVARRFFHPSERAYLEKAGWTPETMLEIWVRKEAYVKLLGTGLSHGLSRFSAVGQGFREEAGEMAGQEGKTEGARLEEPGWQPAQAPEEQDGQPPKALKEPEKLKMGFRQMEQNGKRFFWGDLFAAGATDEEGRNLPLIGAWCALSPAKGAEIRFLDKAL